MLKQAVKQFLKRGDNQPPSGGCVLKQTTKKRPLHLFYQPPSGGCVLKLFCRVWGRLKKLPAAFRRLCVETWTNRFGWRASLPAAFRRLCVETIHTKMSSKPHNSQLPSGGCVLKQRLAGQTEMS